MVNIRWVCSNVWLLVYPPDWYLLPQPKVLWQKLIWFYEFLSQRKMIIAVAQLVSCSMHKFMFITTFEMIFFFWIWNRTSKVIWFLLLLLLQHAAGAMKIFTGPNPNSQVLSLKGGLWLTIKSKGATHHPPTTLNSIAKLFSQ